MFMSRATLNLARMSKRALIDLVAGNSYAYHTLVWSLFQRLDGGPRDFVFRVETRRTPVIFIVSARKPAAFDHTMFVETKPYDPHVPVGCRLAFDVRLNPVVTRTDPTTGRSSKHDVVMDLKRRSMDRSGREEHEAVSQWLANRAADRGFSLSAPERLQIAGYSQHRIGRSTGKDIRFSSVDVVGSLEVTSEERFRHTLFEGLGRSRSFGCGLMLVRRI